MTQELKSVIAARLRAARKARGLSQAAVAEAVSRTEEAISNLERGVSLPRLDLLARFSILYAVPIEELVRAPAGDGAPSERARLEAELAGAARTLPVELLRIAVRQVRAMGEG